MEGVFRSIGVGTKAWEPTFAGCDWEVGGRPRP